MSAAGRKVEVHHAARGDQSPAPGVAGSGNESDSARTARGSVSSAPLSLFALAILAAHRQTGGELADMGGEVTRSLVRAGLLEDVRREAAPGEPPNATRITAAGLERLRLEAPTPPPKDPPRVLLTLAMRYRVAEQILALIGSETTAEEERLIRSVALEIGRATPEEVRHG